MTKFGEAQRLAVTASSNDVPSVGLQLAARGSAFRRAHSKGRFSRQVFRRLWSLVFLISQLWSAADRTRAQAHGIDPNVQISNLYHKRWTAQDGAPKGALWMAQTSDGFLWVANLSGLYRFDGIQFVRFRPSSGDALRNDDLGFLTADNQNGLWVAYRLGGASYIRAGAVRTYSEKDGLPAAPRGAIFSMTVDAEQVTWAATIKGLFRLQGSRWYPVGANWGFPYETARNVWTDHEGTLWVSSGEKVFYSPKGEQVFRDAHVSVSVAADFTEGKDHTIWIFDPSSATMKTMLPSIDGLRIRGPDIPMSSSEARIDQNGSLWIGTDTKGLYRVPYPEQLLDGRTTIQSAPVRHYAEQQGLTGNAITVILPDLEGSVWVVTNKGIDQFRQPALERLDIPDSTFFALSSLHDGSVMIGSAKYLLNWKQRASRIPTPISSDSEGKGIKALYEDNAHTLWIGGANFLWAFSHGRIVQKPLPDHLNPVSHTVQALTGDTAGRLWLSLSGNGTYRFADGVWSRANIFPDMPTIPAIAMLTDHEGNIWFVTASNGVSKLGPRDSAATPIHDGVDIANVMAVTERKGQVWIGGQLGLEVFENGHFHHLKGATNEDFDGITGIAADRAGDLWLNTAAGIAHIESEQIDHAMVRPDSFVQYELFNEFDGLTDAAVALRPLPTITISSDNDIYLATRGSVFHINPSKIYRNPVPPSVEVTSINVDGRLTDSRGEITIPARSQNVEIDYTASSLLIPERVRFRYELEGYDKDWQDPQQRRQAFYSHLPPGHYTFRVRASNNDGVWSATDAVIRLYHPPTVFQTTWFRSLSVGAALAVLWALVQLRTQRALANVRDRLSERLRERERIARELHDTLLQGMQAVILRFHNATMMVNAETPARSKLEEALEYSDRVMEEGRDSVHDIRLKGLNSTDLAYRLSRLPEELGANAEIRFRVLATGDARPIQPVILDDIYRLAREAISNSFQHSKATEITTQIEFGHREFVLSVRDNGIGIAEETLLGGGRVRHWGIPGMRERAKEIGARVVIDSASGSGTHITLTVPASAAYVADADRPSVLLKLRRLLGILS